ncbi:hypothetical protein C8Q76DRAFT_688630 [Earliella scabrosa]|nr:hypothetical protein C8Q76DRAFT_688630 [Earliella scabrosa]
MGKFILILAHSALINRSPTSTRRGKRPVDEYIVEFKNVITRCGITDFDIIKDFFFTGLNSSLRDRIHSCETMPTDAEKLYSKAAQLENQWLMGKAYGGQKMNKTTNTFGGKRPYTAPKERDPDAMDIDRMTAEEREKHFKEGRCFTCHKIGHLSHNCPDKRNQKTQNRTNARVANLEDEDDKRSITSHSTTSTTASCRLVAARVRLALKDLDSDVDREEVLKEVCDKGAGELFVDYRYARMKNMPMKKLPQPIRVFNADGTSNEQGIGLSTDLIQRATALYLRVMIPSDHLIQIRQNPNL